jgi:hypothetical protein
MRLIVATFKVYDGMMDIFLATTIEKAKELLTEQMQYFLSETDYAEDGAEIPNDFDALMEIGWDNELYEVDLNSHKVHSDDHILKYVMEQI